MLAVYYPHCTRVCIRVAYRHVCVRFSELCQRLSVDVRLPCHNVQCMPTFSAQSHVDLSHSAYKATDPLTKLAIQSDICLTVIRFQLAFFTRNPTTADFRLYQASLFSADFINHT